MFEVYHDDTRYVDVEQARFYFADLQLSLQQ